MPRPSKTRSLLVFMNGEDVGKLISSPTGVLTFTYSDSWLNSKNKRSISLSLPLTAHGVSGYLVDNFFDNLLPDNVNIKNRIQARFGSVSNGCFDLLWHIGKDCVGALQFLREGGTQGSVKKIEAEPVTDSSISEIVQNYQTMPLGMGRDDDDFRISIAGAQEKTALLWHNNQWCKPIGTTPTTHIIKLPIGVTRKLDLSESVENEWLCHLILKAYGLDVANTSMHVFDETKTLVVERFDRRLSSDKSWIIRLPQEDMCQAIGVPAQLKYEQDGGPGIQKILRLLRGSENNEQDQYVFMKTQFLFWILAAIDGHAKNFSVFLLPEDRYKLTPLYDVMSAHPYVKSKQIRIQNIKMAMALDGKSRHYAWEQIQERHWAITSKKNDFNVLTMNQIITDVFDNLQTVVDSVKSLIPPGFPELIADSIFSGMYHSKHYFKKQGIRITNLMR